MNPSFNRIRINQTQPAIDPKYFDDKGAFKSSLLKERVAQISEILFPTDHRPPPSNTLCAVECCPSPDYTEIKRQVLDYIESTQEDLNIKINDSPSVLAARWINLIVISDFFRSSYLWYRSFSPPLPIVMKLDINEAAWALIRSFFETFEIPKIRSNDFCQLLDIYIGLTPYAEMFHDPLNLLFKKIEKALCTTFINSDCDLECLYIFFEDPIGQKIGSQILKCGFKKINLRENRLTYIGDIEDGTCDFDLKNHLEQLHPHIQKQVISLKVQNAYISNGLDLQSLFPGLKNLNFIECEFENNTLTLPPLIEKLSISDCSLKLIAPLVESGQSCRIRSLSLKFIDHLTTLPGFLINEYTEKIKVIYSENLKNISSLKNGPFIKKLSLANCQQIDQCQYSVLKNLLNIQSLDISNTSFNLTAQFHIIHNMTSLTYLNIEALPNSWFQSDYDKLKFIKNIKGMPYQ